MSKQTTFALACAAALSALIPGVGGYLSARMEAIETAERNLRARESRLELREARPVAFLGPCLRTPPSPRSRHVPATALGDREHRQRRPRGLQKELERQ
ncbi:hypothetical protein [Nonomuraea jiangxiensis]|uniref:Uncharacterized protein n=1 Tax=Nonomuraea jiangxiensis TaxID=633440 RepID=A0A1G9L3Z8_9ACTN|nr:hypothetical protein [Nonomuraea jiangxiensis]SDL56651.1 hypothetical protein SAMN05421869_12785 [Nonomuraea jiangxiensis]